MNFKEFYISKYLNRPLIEEEFFKEEFDQFKKEYVGTDAIFESPLFAGNYGGSFNNPLLNKIRLQNVFKNDDYIKNLIFAGIPFKLYRGKGNDLIEDSLVYNDDLLALYAYYKPLNDGGAEIDSSWSHLDMRDIFRFYFWEELFPQYSYIQSSNSNTVQSMNFWIKICKESKEKGFKFVVINLKDGDEKEYSDYKELENNKNEIWGNFLGDIRLRVYNKN